MNLGERDRGAEVKLTGPYLHSTGSSSLGEVSNDSLLEPEKETEGGRGTEEPTLP
jgi:hypothetical protein